MSSVSHILVPTQFTTRCERALCRAAAFASRFDARLSVLHVLEPVTHLAFDTARTLEQVERYRREWAEREMEKLTWNYKHSVRLHTECVEGDPAVMILRYAVEPGADLIFMATHGHTPVRQFLLGSVTARILHDAKCPVCTDADWTRESEGHPGGPITQIVCGVDPGAHAQRVLAWSKMAAQAWHAKLALVHVLPAGHHGQQAHRDCEVARSRLEEYENELDLQAGLHVVRGDVAEELATCVSALRAELLVVGRGRPRGGRLSTHCGEILRESVCPVVSV